MNLEPETLNPTRVGVIRVEDMAVERMDVLRRLEKDRGVGLVSTLSEYVVLEEALMGSDFWEGFTALIAQVQVVFIAVPGAYASRLATESIRSGLHTFLGRSAVPSIAECERIAALGEEAGVEIGISRIMRYHPFLRELPDSWRASSLAIHHERSNHDQIGFQQMIEDAVDLCCSLAGISEVRKIEAQLVQMNRVHPSSLMIGFRFQNGTYAQIQLRQGVTTPRYVVYAGGGSYEIEVDLIDQILRVRNAGEGENDNDQFAFEGQSLKNQPLNQNLIERETTAFLEALTNHKPAPISIMNDLQTLRLVESIRETLR